MFYITGYMYILYMIYFFKEKEPRMSEGMIISSGEEHGKFISTLQIRHVREQNSFRGAGHCLPSFGT